MGREGHSRVEISSKDATAVVLSAVDAEILATSVAKSGVEQHAYARALIALLPLSVYVDVMNADRRRIPVGGGKAMGRIGDVAITLPNRT